MTTRALTIKQVAEVLQVSPDTVYGLAARGELEGRKIGRIWRFHERAVEEYMSGKVAVESVSRSPQERSQQ